MIQPMLYNAVLLFELILVTSILLYLSSLLYSSFKGAPYVPTKQKLIKNILDEAHLKKGQRFLDLGCGDGRVVGLAAKNYKVRGIGVDINPFVLLLAKIKAKFQRIEDVSFVRENILDTDLSRFDVLYLFLLPDLLEKLVGKLQKETKNNALIISHGFQIPEWKKYLKKTVMTDPFPTYYYSRASSLTIH